MKKIYKDILITIVVVSAIILSVLSWHFSDEAQKPFWWNFWTVIGYMSILFIVLGWLWLRSQENKRN